MTDPLNDWKMTASAGGHLLNQWPSPVDSSEDLGSIAPSLIQC